MDDPLDNMKEGLIIDAKGTVRSTDEIRRSGMLDTPIVHNTPLPQPESFDYWVARAVRRQNEFRETLLRSPNFVEVTLPAQESAIFFWGDLHDASPFTDYVRFRAEVDAFKRFSNLHAITLADMVDGFFWGGAAQGEQLEGLDEQHQFLKSFYKEVKGRVICGVSGEHDSKWATKSGPDPYAQFSEETGGHYIRGVGEVLIHCGVVDYRLVIAHKLRGNSMYNKNHPQAREARFGIQGADVYVSAHTHQKSITQEAVREFGDKAREVTYISVGPYKNTDEYAQRSGYNNQKPEQLYGVAILLSPTHKKIQVDGDMVRAAQTWGR